MDCGHTCNVPLEFALAVGAVYDRALFFLKHYKLWVLREIVRGRRPRLQQTQQSSMPEVGGYKLLGL
jgi:hypothetical protein